MRALNKCARPILRLLKVFICAAVLLAVAAAILFGVWVAKYPGRYLFLRSILMQKPAPMLPPRDLFREYVFDPIPASVTDIRADQTKKYRGYGYTLRFKIDRPDLAALIGAGPLKRVWNVTYKKGRLFWAWDTTWDGQSLSGVDIIVYYPEDLPEPSWFRPERWADPEAYAFCEESKGNTNTRVLPFNEKEGEAYFFIESFR